VVLALPSTGLHTNGFSLARKLLFEVSALTPDSYVDELGQTVGEELLSIHRSYLKPIRALHEARLLQAAAHITGGGITDNVPRSLPDGLSVRIDTNAWKVPPLFEMLRRAGNVPIDDWRRTFNLGIGMVLIVREKDESAANTALRKLREKPIRIGEVIPHKRGRARVEYE
jgi:phosphoribosylformylglycinamidine cyclo-ligase